MKYVELDESRVILLYEAFCEQIYKAGFLPPTKGRVKEFRQWLADTHPTITRNGYTLRPRMHSKGERDMLAEFTAQVETEANIDE
jgi:hypothetical protein